MSDFFNVLGDVFSLLNNWKIFGDISLLHILLTCIVISVIGSLLKGNIASSNSGKKKD